jgi:hypothetical protein
MQSRFIVVILAVITVLVLVLCVFTLMLAVTDVFASAKQKITIILTCTVRCQANIRKLVQTDPGVRVATYLAAIRKWLTDTDYNIVVVENSGYTFPELRDDLEKYPHRFEVITFDENEQADAEYLKHTTSKGRHEMYAIDYAIRTSKLIPRSVFVIKITGRYFIPNFAKHLFATRHAGKYMALRQHTHDSCEIVGANVKHLDAVFNKHSMHDHVEKEWLNRLAALPQSKVYTLRKLDIPPTVQGGTGKVKTDL